jgi:hypothetical protein
MWLGDLVSGTYLPASLDAVEVLAEGAPQDPQLGQAELVGLLDLGLPHVDRRLGAVVLLALNVRYRVLKNSQESEFILHAQN